MGSLFGQSTPAPPPPAPPTTIRDEINGVEQVPVTNADGTVTYVTRAIELTADQQAEQDRLDSIMKDALAEIERLSASDYADDDETRKVLDAWEATRKDIIDDDFDRRQQQEEAVLARRGLADSTAATNIRRQRRLDLQDAELATSRERDLLSQNIRNERIGLQQNLYGLAASQDNADAVGKQQAAVSGQSLLVANERARQASLNDYYGYELTRASEPSVFSDLATLGLTVGGFFAGGPAGAAAGAGIGSSLFYK